LASLASAYIFAEKDSLEDFPMSIEEYYHFGMNVIPESDCQTGASQKCPGSEIFQSESARLEVWAFPGQHLQPSIVD
jgi:hypothetical protein